MSRSSNALNIFRTPDPNRTPYIVGRVPSAGDGRLLDVSYGVSPEGKWGTETTDRGRLSESPDNFFYLKVFGGTISMNQSDMHECVEEMVYAKKEKDKRVVRNTATANELRNKVADLIDSVNNARVDRKVFGSLGGR